MLEPIAARITEQKGWLLFSNLPAKLISGQDLREYFESLGLVRKDVNVKIFWGTRKRARSAFKNALIQGDLGDELLLIRKVTVRILLAFGEQKFHLLAAIGRGDFFGDMSFLDG